MLLLNILYTKLVRYIVFSKGFGVTVSIDAKETEYQEAKNH